MNILMIKIKPKYSIKKQKEQKKKKKTKFESLYSMLPANCSNCASRRRKNTNLKKKCSKNFGNFEKSSRYLKRNAQGTGQFGQYTQNLEILRFEIPRVFFLMKC